jgi:hypothetical protein
VTKQPFLIDFPLTVFATAKRRLQAAIRQSSAIITRRPLSGYAVLFEHILAGDFLSSIDPTLRSVASATCRFSGRGWGCPRDR